jgi:hypothetical protein
MAPEAYTVLPAIKAWINGDSEKTIRLEAAKGYAACQNISLQKSKRLFKCE